MTGEAKYRVLVALQANAKDAGKCRAAMIELQSEAFWRSHVGNDYAGYRSWRKAVRRAYSQYVGLTECAIQAKQDREATLFRQQAA